MNRRALALLSPGHFLIDLCQGVVPALAPFLVERRGFSNAEAAGLVFAISATSSVVQPVFGQLADKLAMGWLLPASIFLSGVALALGAQSAGYAWVVLAFGLSGLGVAAFHPEAARKANIASGDRRTTGMSFFSIGGGIGFALAPTVTLVLVEARGMAGLLFLLYPTILVAGLIAARLGLASPPHHHNAGDKPWPELADDWRGFGILCGAMLLRSIVFYGLNTFLALYFMGRWGQTAVQASRASAIFLGTSIVGTLLGGWLADRIGRREALRIGFTGGTVLLGLFLATPDPFWALAVLVPLAVFLFIPASVLVVMGQEYLPNRVGLASGMTLGLAVSIGGMSTPLLGRLADRHGMGIVVTVLLALMAIATAHAFALPPAGRRQPAPAPEGLIPVTADR
jgi:MFS transporter, FSR family, fosmidomycin resistance protein